MRRPPFGAPLRDAAAAAALFLAAGCTAVPPQDTAAPPMPADYGVLVANAIKPYKDFAGYNNFEISPLRWIDASTGWRWRACIRFTDRGVRRTYVLFIRDHAVIEGRYDILADSCGIEPYVPFDAATGAIGVPATQPLRPLR